MQHKILTLMLSNETSSQINILLIVYWNGVTSLQWKAVTYEGHKDELMFTNRATPWTVYLLAPVTSAGTSKNCSDNKSRKCPLWTHVSEDYMWKYGPDLLCVSVCVPGVELTVQEIDPRNQVWNVSCKNIPSTWLQVGLRGRCISCISLQRLKDLLPWREHRAIM